MNWSIGVSKDHFDPTHWTNLTQNSIDENTNLRKSWSILWIHTLQGSIKYFLDDAFSIIIFKSLDERSHKNFTYESGSQSYNFNLELWKKQKHICFRCSFVIVSQKDMMHSFEKRKTKPSHCHHWYGKIKQA